MAVTTTNSKASPAVVRNAATSMSVVKIAHAIRNQPVATPYWASGIFAAKNVA